KRPHGLVARGLRLELLSHRLHLREEGDNFLRGPHAHQLFNLSRHSLEPLDLQPSDPGVAVHSAQFVADVPRGLCQNGKRPPPPRPPRFYRRARRGGFISSQNTSVSEVCLAIHRSSLPAISMFRSIAPPGRGEPAGGHWSAETATSTTPPPSTSAAPWSA